MSDLIARLREFSKSVAPSPMHKACRKAADALEAQLLKHKEISRKLSRSEAFALVVDEGNSVFTPEALAELKAGYEARIAKLTSGLYMCISPNVPAETTVHDVLIAHTHFAMNALKEESPLDALAAHDAAIRRKTLEEAAVITYEAETPLEAYQELTQMAKEG